MFTSSYVSEVDADTVKRCILNEAHNNTDPTLIKATCKVNDGAKKTDNDTNIQIIQTKEIVHRHIF